MSEFQNPAARNKHMSANGCWPSSSSNMGVGTSCKELDHGVGLAAGHAANRAFAPCNAWCTSRHHNTSMRLQLSGWALQTSRLQSCFDRQLLGAAASSLPRIPAISLGPAVLQQVNEVSSNRLRTSMQPRSAISEQFAASMPKAEIGAQDFLQVQPNLSTAGACKDILLHNRVCR